MEALVRWNHPQKGLIQPNDFISIAEETGLIIPLDMWMMENTMKIMQQWHKEGLNTGRLSLNLSIKQLESKGCIERFKKVIEDTGVDANYLELEITEGQIMQDSEHSITVLQEIRDLGVHVSIDDFGTGYSSLSYLKRLPIDTLKIDRSFINDLPDDEEDSAIVKAIVVLANSLKLELIAEGVETQEQQEYLVSEGCSNIQGYYYSKPLEREEYKEFLLKYQ